MVRDPKHLRFKGFLGATAAAFAIISYIIYYIYLAEYSIKLNELFFISTGIGISVFSGLLFTFFREWYVRVWFLYASVFYGLLVFSYIGYWILLGQPYGDIKNCLIAGFVAGIIYCTYDYLRRRSYT